MSTVDTGARPGPGESPDRQTGSQTAGAAGQAARDIGRTTAEQARGVAGDASTRVRKATAEIRDTVAEQARVQNGRVVDGLRRVAGELDRMAEGRDDSPARAIVTRVASSGHRLADHLDERGPEGVLEEITEFARRKPGTFLAAAAVSGFVVGRLGKAVLRAEKDGSPSPGEGRAPEPYGEPRGFPAEGGGTL